MEITSRCKIVSHISLNHRCRTNSQSMSWPRYATVPQMPSVYAMLVDVGYPSTLQHRCVTSEYLSTSAPHHHQQSYPSSPSPSLSPSPSHLRHPHPFASSLPGASAPILETSASSSHPLPSALRISGPV